MKKIFSLIAVLVAFVSFSDNPLSAELYFNEGSEELSKVELKKIDKLLTSINLSQIRAVHVLGYADKEGNELYNFELSKKRAISIKDYLVSKGLKESLFKIYYFGEFKAPDKAPAKNRKAKLEIYYQQEGENPVHIPLTQFKTLPFDIDGDSLADFEATYVKIGSKEFFKWKGNIKEIKKDDRTLIFHFHRVDQSYLMPGDTLADIPKKRWGRNADVLVRYDNDMWGPYRRDLQGQIEFYCGFKLAENGVRSVGWLKFKVVPQTGELLLIDKEIKENEWIVVGEH